MAAHCCCLSMKANFLSNQWGETESFPHGAHAVEGPQSHAVMPRKHRFWLWSPSRTSILPPPISAQNPTPQPTHPGSGVPQRTKAANEGLDRRKRAGAPIMCQERRDIPPTSRTIGATALVCLCASSRSRALHGSSASSSLPVPMLSTAAFPAAEPALLQGAPICPCLRGWGFCARKG